MRLNDHFIYHFIFVRFALKVWMAEQRTEAEKKKQDALRSEYEREQDIYCNRYLS